MVDMVADPLHTGVQNSGYARKSPSAHIMPFGAEMRAGGGVRFSLWAPAQGHVRLALGNVRDPLEMQALPQGWHTLNVPAARPGVRYDFVLEDNMHVPDPASRFQPEGLHGRSEVIDPELYKWRNASWRGLPWHEVVLYELHVGTFTPEGIFRTAIEKLDHLRGLGINAIELMPVAEFPGKHSWGYDGVLLFAPSSNYGRPEDLKALVDAAHDRGMMMILDVVYNHFGPEGNYLPLYAPGIYSERHHTPWGSAINFDGPESRPVRDLIIHNALYWLEEYRFDGLRLDAVHAIIDDSRKHILEELAEGVRASIDPNRYVHLLLENNANQSRFLIRAQNCAPHWYTAQWNDDLHHGLHVAATHESAGYYMDFAGDLGELGRALAEGFSYQGEPSAFGKGRSRGEPSAFLPPDAFVSFIQNHDQVGNRAFGERLNALAKTEAVRAVAAIYLLAPQIPMLFMGEEWAASSPFPFFCDLSGDLRDAVREGRRKEFAAFPEFQDPAKQEQIPDPISASTFQSAKLDWEELRGERHHEWLRWYGEILRVRDSEIVPRLRGVLGNTGTFAVHDKVLWVKWQLGDRSYLILQTCLSDQSSLIKFKSEGRLIWREGNAEPGQAAGPWAVLYSILE